MPLNNYFVVVVNDVPELSGDMITKLTEFAQSGHGVWFILGHQADQAFFNNTLSKTPLLPITLKQRHIAATSAGIDVKDPDSPMVSMLAAAERNAFTGVALNQWWQVQTRNADVRIILNATNGDPLVLEHVLGGGREIAGGGSGGGGGGRVAIWTTSVDGQWNNLPLVTNFLPLVHETLYHLASSQVSGLNRRLESGGNLFWSGPSAPVVQSASITYPDATVHKADPLLSSDGRWIVNHTDTYMPGLYELRFSPTDIPQPVYYSVNIDQRELDPATLSATDISWLQEGGYVKERIADSGLAAAMGAQNRGTELWPVLALGLLGMLILETYLTRRILRLQVRENAAQMVSAGGRA